ncbi:MAG: hypothetical protein AVDCRST_MAG73-987 [uncultured Thermomicrobiales bacterium]|uniref:Uncharacterized protein n=1 Tax=uncultured Thermomicrobiales bacterium TaxID=1645740 RepID=A0A6J4TT10_9BACT|nr:MAG: hypothetical protein AVDCRST_MAG73-987 [uncultured Thermomicrobiales bacterium]
MWSPCSGSCRREPHQPRTHPNVTPVDDPAPPGRRPVRSLD